jgi:hypothetical protein
MQITVIDIRKVRQHYHILNSNSMSALYEHLT